MSRPRKVLTCAYRNCNNTFFREGSKRFCCPACRGLEYRLNEQEQANNGNPEYVPPVCDRPFTELADRMIVYADAKGESLVMLARMLRRSLGAVQYRIEELKTYGIYHEYALDMRRHQADTMEVYSKRGGHIDGGVTHAEVY